ncbi:MAG: YebC/PmpR family DNA-binding transcriptional regulator [Phycisphaeraceae bacterium]|nr:YebC/PmpR family DNA-binding transcriptional regulator [Phycisphaeraceae bacterium]
MAGHSKWANIKHRKAAVDKKRGKVWSKCSRAIITAARNGGGDPASNLPLRYAVLEAKAANMPKDTIERAIAKGAGELGGDNYENARYEGYGPSGVAVVVDALTDNRARTAPDLRAAFTKHGGNLGTSGCVSYIFEQRGVITLEDSSVTEERLMEIALEAGADDIQREEGVFIVTTPPTEFLAVKEALDSAGVETASAELTMVANTTVQLGAADAAKLLKLVDALEDLDDVQKVYTNAEIDDDALANA